MRNRFFVGLELGLGLSLVMAAPAPLHAHGEGELLVTSEFIQAPHDRVPRFCNVAGSPQMFSIVSGAWSDPGVWNTGVVPAANARVKISANTSVTYDLDSDTRLDCIEVSDHGKLRFATDRSTKMLIDVLMVMPEGHLWIGDAATPLPSSHTAQLIFRGDTPLKTGTVGSPGIDPQQYGRGLIAFGIVDMHGHRLEQTFIRLASEPLAGDTALHLEHAPTGWRPGDTLIIPDTRQIPFRSGQTFTSQGEEVVIQSISGSAVTLTAPLAHDHRGPRGAHGNVGPIELSLLPHAGNLTRNIVLRSEETSDNSQRGHTLFLHRADIDIRYAVFKDLGRTTIANLDNTTFDETGAVDKIGSNQIGRYSMHLHHLWGPVNPSNTGYQLEVVGNVLHGMNKWGMTVHDTHYGLIQWNIAYDGIGSAIATEEGNEAFNVFERNFVVHTRAGATRPILSHSVGRGGVFDSRALFGTTRDAFWFSGQYNYVRDNVAANVPDFAYNYNGYYIKATMRVPRFRGANILDPDEYEGWNFHESGRFFVEGRDRREGLPVLESARNEAYGATGQGLWLTWSRGCCGVSYYQQESLFEDYRLWHLNHTGVYAFHESRNTFAGFIMRDDTAVSRLNGPNARFNRGFWLGTSAYENGQLIIRDFDIQGFNIGIAMPPNPQDGTAEANVSVVENGVLKNHINLQEFFVSGVTDKQTIVRNVRFTPVLAYESNRLSANPINILMSPSTDKQMRPMRPSEMYVYDFNGQPGNSFQLSWREQAPDAVVLPPNRPDLHAGNPDVTCPQEGLTNQQCWDQYGVAVAGAVAPCVEADNDDCSAANTRAGSLEIVGLLFPLSDSQPTATNTSVQPEDTATPEATPTPTASATATATTAPPVATETTAPTATTRPTDTPTHTATATDSPVPTASPTPDLTLTCAASPLTNCVQPSTRTSLSIYKGIRQRFNRLRFRWFADDQAPENFPSPATSGFGYAFCLYDHNGSAPTEVYSVAAPADALCNDEPCWASARTFGAIHRYSSRDATGGARRMVIGATVGGRARLGVYVSGSSLSALPLPLAEDQKVTAQIQSNSGGCWEANFSAPADRNDQRRYRAQH